MSGALEKKETVTQLSGFRISPLAGKPAPREMLVDLARLEKEYFDRKPDLEDANQFVVFGTSGHRGMSLNHSHLNMIISETQEIVRNALGQS
jgi:phosphoglucomutase